MNDELMQTDAKSVQQAVSDTSGLRPVVVRKRAGARIAAVQLAYSLCVTGQEMQRALPEFLDHYAQIIARQLKVKTIDDEHFQLLASGMYTDKEAIDTDIAASLSEGWSLQRLGIHEVCILRAGIFELKAMAHIPARAILSEYAGLADIFSCDVSFINAVLDRLARRFRTAELQGSA